MKKRIFIFLSCGLLALVLLVAAGVGAAWYWATQPISMTADKVDFVVEPGSSVRTIVRQLNASGLTVWEPGFVWMARLSEQDKLIKAGGYEASRGDSPWLLLTRMARGDMSQRQVTLVEGWNMRQIRQALRAHPDVKQTLDGVSDKDIVARLGGTGDSLEGLIFPDTYVFSPGTSDFDLLRRGYKESQAILAEIWAERDPDLPLADPYQLLILASIVEKETGHTQDRDRVAGVFINRLRIGMPLQTDPTVIYGMGEAYDGRIRKRDLQTDTPWNTYTRNGLPPTPIASPGRAALRATVHPETHKFLYFVSRGDGTSEFATNLADHNRNVSRFILGRTP
ncbi:endolytic transglycosylase MltG [Schauerella aestuarii]|uniref:endolytic transglycosylase MltG n=1 Tax=Schauerella aestuarii TaxID=2511204 RepID=UPI00136D0B70|nr:endolytic transglycosylase MltG [Achromobacter aestuarii]MYZ44827.1 endolytic transglycosylase MltG [Achromobacter aestuarii]